MLHGGLSRMNAGMGSALNLVVTLCGPVGGTGSAGALLLGLALAGAAGSPMHCVPMCGGFVLGQVADRMAHLHGTQLCEWRRLRAGMLLPYHLGRLTTYAGLGAVAGLVGSALTRLPWLGWLSTLLLLTAAAIFLIHAAQRLGAGWTAGSPWQPPAAWRRLIARMTAHVDRTRWGGSYALGVALGLLPCGLLYAALAAAASGRSVTLGALGMLAFGSGTAPALIMLGVAGQAAGRHWHRALATAAPLIMLANAGLLIALALQHLGTT